MILEREKNLEGRDFNSRNCFLIENPRQTVSNMRFGALCNLPITHINNLLSFEYIPASPAEKCLVGEKQQGAGD